MRYLKTFESFNVNETLDMMSMPVDPIAGAADVYGDIYDKVKSYLKSSFEDFEEKLDQAIVSALPKIDTDKALESARKFFGKDPLSVTAEDVKLALEKANESWVDKYDESDPYGNLSLDTTLKDVKGGMVQKIGHILQSIFAVNLLSFGLFGSFLTWLAGTAVGPGMSMVYAIVGFIVVHIIRKLAAM